MADNPFGTGMAFQDGSVFSPTGVAQNTTAQTSLSNLGVSGTAYNTFIPPNVNTPVSTNHITSGGLNIPAAMPLSDSDGSGLVSSAVNSAGMNQQGTSDTPGLDAATGLYQTGDYSKDPQYAQAQAQLNSSQQQYMQAANQLPSQAALFSNAQNVDNGFGSATSNAATVKDLTTKLANLNATYVNAAQKAETDGVNSGTPSVVYQGAQAAIQRQGAVMQGAIAAQLQSAQGNYQAAEQLATQSANLQFQDAQAKIDNLKSFISLNQDNLSSAEKLAVSKMDAQAKAAQTQLDNQKDARTFALTNNVNQPFYQVGGIIYRTSDGKAYSTPEEAKAAGVGEDYGNVQLVTGDITQGRSIVAQLATKYFDAGINLSDSLATAQQKAKGSAEFRKETYIAPSAGSGGGGTYIPGTNPTVDAYITAVKNGNATLTNVPAAYRGLVAQGLSAGVTNTIVDPQTDQGVKSIIDENPGQYGAAADAIDAKYGKGTATKYDSQLQAVYNSKSSSDDAFAGSTIYSPLAASRFTTASNKITSPYEDTSAYKLVADGAPYVQRILTAAQNPGSIGDQELLDAFTKLSTSGNAISDAQIKTITGGKSIADTASTYANQFKNGGVLSNSQRQQIVDIAQQTLQAYQSIPVYQQATAQLTAAGIPPQFWTIPDLSTLYANVGNTNSGGQTVQSNGQEYTVGQVYNDGTSNWTVDAQGNWTKQ